MNYFVINGINDTWGKVKFDFSLKTLIVSFQSVL